MNADNKIKVIKKIDIKNTILQLGVGSAFSFKITKDLTSGQVRACVSRINAEGVRNFSTNENGLQIKVIRNK